MYVLQKPGQTLGQLIQNSVGSALGYTHGTGNIFRDFIREQQNHPSALNTNTQSISTGKPFQSLVSIFSPLCDTQSQGSNLPSAFEN